MWKSKKCKRRQKDYLKNNFERKDKQGQLWLQDNEKHERKLDTSIGIKEYDYKMMNCHIILNNIFILKKADQLGSKLELKKVSMQESFVKILKTKRKNIKWEFAELKM